MIDGCNEKFRTLNEVRQHVWLADGEGFNGSHVMLIEGDEARYKAFKDKIGASE